jgi:hypothetical protein
MKTYLGVFTMQIDLEQELKKWEPLVDKVWPEFVAANPDLQLSKKYWGCTHFLRHHRQSLTDMGVIVKSKKRTKEVYANVELFNLAARACMLNLPCMPRAEK